MRFAVGMGRDEPIIDVPRLARAAEESGFSFVTFVDQPNISRDINVAMALAAQSTERIRIGHGVLDPVTHRPWVIANASATLDELSGGRQIIGIGTGGPYGKAMRPLRLDQLAETVQFIRAYLRGEDVAIEGVKIRSEWMRRDIPVYIGTSGPKLSELAGEIADGVMLGSNADPVHVGWQLEHIAKGAARAGRSMDEIDVWARGMIYVTDSMARARREAAGYAVNSSRRYGTMLRRSTPEMADLRARLDRAHPGLVEQCFRVADVWTPEQHERADTPAAAAVTDEIIDTQHLVGTAGDVLDKLGALQRLGIKTFATVTYTIIDKEAMIRTIGSEIISRAESGEP